MSVQADNIGNLSGQIIVPAGVVRSGAREFILTGNAGSVGRMTVHFQDTEGGPTEERPFDQRVRPIGMQAIAQTFQLPESRYVRQVQVKFCTIGDGSNPVWMQIRETQNGIPTNAILGEKVLYPPYITAGRGWTTFQFEPVIPLIGGIEYAIVMMTSDPNYTVAIARQGQFVNEGDGPSPPYPGWITEQPYQVGVLQVSSDIDTWSAMQDADLTFRITGCLFSPTTKDVALGNVTPEDNNATDAMVKAVVHRPFGEADCHFVVAHPGSGESHTDLENAKIRLSTRRTGAFSLTAHLEGSAHASPLLFPNSKLELGNMLDDALYVTVPVDAGDEFNLTIIFDALRQGNSTITPFVAVQRYSGPDPVVVGGVYQWDWVEVTDQLATLAIGNGWTEETWRMPDVLRGILPDYQTRIKLELSGGPAARPIVKNLRAITILAGEPT